MTSLEIMTAIFLVAVAGRGYPALVRGSSIGGRWVQSSAITTKWEISLCDLNDINNPVLLEKFYCCRSS
jgi:hypothetical protein